MSQFKISIVPTIALFVMSLLVPSLASASGGYGGGGGGFGGGYSKPAQRKPVDQNYEYGKAVYQGRADDFKKYKYCVAVEGEKVPAKRRAMKHFIGKSYKTLANSLYDCDRPDQLIGLEAPKEKFEYVLYYLNKRFKLDLTHLNDA